MDKILKKLLVNIRREFDNSTVMLDDYGVEELRNDKFNSGMPNFIEKLAVEIYNRLPKNTIIEPMDMPVVVTENQDSIVEKLIEASTWKFEYKMSLSMFEQLGETKAIPIIANNLSKELNQLIDEMDIFRPYILVQGLRAVPMDEYEKYQKDPTYKYKTIIGFRTRFGKVTGTYNPLGE